MALFFRVILMSVVALTIVYVCLLLFLRARKREQLEEAWFAAGQPGERATEIEAALEEYIGPVRRKLIWGVYIIPLCAIAVVVYVTSFG